MLSTPAPTPTSIMPELIAFAISTQACRPEEHCLFKLLTAAETGNPAAKAAARNSVAPPPGGRTEPTAISSTKAGSIFERSMSDLNAPTSISAAAVSLNPPFPPLVNAVRRHAVTTIWQLSVLFFRRFNGYPTYIVWVLLQKLGSTSISLCRSNLALRASKVARDLSKALICYDSLSASPPSIHHFSGSNVPADMVVTCKFEMQRHERGYQE